MISACARLVVNDAIAIYPRAVIDDAAVGPPADDAIATRHSNGAARWTQCAGKHGATGAEDLAGNLLAECPGEAAMAGGDCRAPANRAVLARQFFDHLQQPARRSAVAPARLVRAAAIGRTVQRSRSYLASASRPAPHEPLRIRFHRVKADHLRVLIRAINVIMATLKGSGLRRWLTS